MIVVELDDKIWVVFGFLFLDLGLFLFFNFLFSLRIMACMDVAI